MEEQMMTEAQRDELKTLCQVEIAMNDLDRL